VHYAGVGDRVDELSELCARAGVSLVEDNAHGLGATFDGRKLGTFGSMSTLSFHETKNVSCGEGGALTLNSSEFLDYAEILREKGTDRARFLRGQIDKYTWTAVGSSWVASDILAAYLVGQLERFDAIQRRRRQIWDMYDRELHGWATINGLRSPMIPEKSEHSAHLYYVHLQNAEERSRFIRHMRKQGVMAVFHYQALNTSPMGQRLGGKPGQCPIAEDASNTLVRIPLFGDLTDSEVDQVITAVTDFE
jgi:dTDP-4-amino-4,6-dideoxygalactose transaminase